jgi:hypothetical protein
MRTVQCSCYQKAKDSAFPFWGSIQGHDIDSIERCAKSLDALKHSLKELYLNVVVPESDDPDFRDYNQIEIVFV